MDYDDRWIIRDLTAAIFEWPISSPVSTIPIWMIRKKNTDEIIKNDYKLTSIVIKTKMVTQNDGKNPLIC